MIHALLMLYKRSKAKKDFEEDVKEVTPSIIKDLAKELKRNVDVTVGKALNEIMEDLDVALIGSERQYAYYRVKVVETAAQRIGLYENNDLKLKDYLYRLL